MTICINEILKIFIIGLFVDTFVNFGLMAKNYEKFRCLMKMLIECDNICPFSETCTQKGRTFEASWVKFRYLCNSTLNSLLLVP